VDTSLNKECEVRTVAFPGVDEEFITLGLK
jgi:hypothetical protein